MDDIAVLAHVANHQDVTPYVVQLEKENQGLRNSMYITFYYDYYKYCANMYANSNSTFYMKTISNN